MRAVEAKQRVLATNDAVRCVWTRPGANARSCSRVGLDVHPLFPLSLIPSSGRLRATVRGSQRTVKTTSTHAATPAVCEGGRWMVSVCRHVIHISVAIILANICRYDPRRALRFARLGGLIVEIVENNSTLPEPHQANPGSFLRTEEGIGGSVTLPLAGEYEIL